MRLTERTRGHHCIFRAEERGGVWAVTNNDAFYGDYLTRAQAIDGACSGARDIEAFGGSAEVIAGPGDDIIRHQRPRK